MTACRPLSSCVPETCRLEPNKGVLTDVSIIAAGVHNSLRLRTLSQHLLLEVVPHILSSSDITNTEIPCHMPVKGCCVGTDHKVGGGDPSKGLRHWWKCQRHFPGREFRYIFFSDYFFCYLGCLRTDPLYPPVSFRSLNGTYAVRT